MRVKPEDLKVVAYVCEARAGQITPVGTAFLARLCEQKPESKNRHFYYWVTAQHVISNIQNAPILRINRKNSIPFEKKTGKDEWCLHSHSDIAVFPFRVDDKTLCELDVTPVDTLLFATPDYKRPNLGDIPRTQNPLDISIGDDVIFFGLFAQHGGKDKNLPIVRFGNVARVPTEETIKIQIDAVPTYRSIIAYLVEAKSWGGQSGSPAFWQAEFTFKPKNVNVKPEEKTRKRVSCLMGIVSSHFDISQKAQSTKGMLDDITTKLNTGIAIVVPAHFIADLIMNDPDLKNARDSELAPERENRGRH
jgi:hypothetical protein